MRKNNSHRRGIRGVDPGTKQFQKPTRPAFGRGWIDLNKKRRGVLAAILMGVTSLAVLAAAIPGARSLWSGYKGDASSNEFAKSSMEDRIASPPTEPVLQREYLYASNEMIAVEDAGATFAAFSELAVWRPSTGVWWVKAGTETDQISVSWGHTGDIPVVGDYDGDGKADFAVYRPSEGRWYILKSSSGDGQPVTISLGSEADTPVPADFDGDGKTDAAIWNERTGRWSILNSRDGSMSTKFLGRSGDIAVPRDYDGDGKADPAIWKRYQRRFEVLIGDSVTAKLMPASGDPLPGDYDGDGKSDFAVRSGNVWHIVKTRDGESSSTVFQNATDIPVPGDFDGDGKTDLAVWRPTNGLWLVLRSATGVLVSDFWGTNGDKPLPAAFKRK
ncbi:MAG: FG-GAP-like repeat-containing protein [Pyrinomonadaceae bacterium]